MRLELLIALIPVGIWLIIDGIYSIWEYLKQTPPEHAIRVVRAGLGVFLIILYFLITRL